MNKKRNDEVLDLVGSFPKYEKYKKLYGRGHNFNFKFIITPGVFKFLAIFKISFNRGTCVEGKVEKRTGGLKRIS